MSPLRLALRRVVADALIDALRPPAVRRKRRRAFPSARWIEADRRAEALELALCESHDRTDSEELLARLPEAA